MTAVFDRILFITTGTMTYIRALMSSKFGQIRPGTTELPALEHPKNQFCHFFSAVFIRSFSYLQVMMACMRARRISKFGHIRPPTAELAALERMKKNPHGLVMGKRCCHFFSAILCQILFIIAGNYDIQKSLDAFKIRPDPATDHRVSCP